MTQPWSWNAAETTRNILKGRITATDVALAALDRIEACEDERNALSEITTDDALRAAQAVDAALARGDDPGPLAGVPVTIKNNVDQTGTRNTGGLVAAKDLVATSDSPLVANLRDSGAVFVGRTNVPAFSFRWFTETVLHGATRNPHRADHSPGGSSGGAGVAVASGYCGVAHGNDIGGSIRQPALMNGVIGLRPTVGRVPSFTPSSGGSRALTSQMFTAEGPLTRTVEDARIVLNVMSARSAYDPQQVPVPAVTKSAPPANVGLMREPVFDRMAPETDRALEFASQVFAEHGCHTCNLRLPRFEDAFRIWTALLSHTLQHSYHGDIIASGDEALIHKVQTLAEISNPLREGDVLELWTERLQIQRLWSQQFEETPVIVMPVSFRHGLALDADQGNSGALQILLEDQSPLLATALLGHPAITVPTGIGKNGLPTAVQLIARWWDEATLLAAAEVLERACPPVTPV